MASAKRTVPGHFVRRSWLAIRLALAVREESSTTWEMNSGVSDIEKINAKVLEKTIRRCRERKIVIPTFAQLKDPATIPAAIQERLGGVGMSEIDPVNLFRITWKNEPDRSVRRRFNNGNWIEFPPALTGVQGADHWTGGQVFSQRARIRSGRRLGAWCRDWSPASSIRPRRKRSGRAPGTTAAGERLTVRFLGCTAVAILPEQMSRERFEWLESIGAEVIKTPGGESNVKEIYDKCWEIQQHPPGLRDLQSVRGIRERDLALSLDRPGIVDETFRRHCRARAIALAGYISATGIRRHDRRGRFPANTVSGLTVVATEALQCPTLLRCGFGDHRIEGIGDKHVPWIHNVRNTDVVCADRRRAMPGTLRLFNEDAGRAFLRKQAVPQQVVDQLALWGFRESATWSRRSRRRGFMRWTNATCCLRR